jgi:hypothetical protein
VASAIKIVSAGIAANEKCAVTKKSLGNNL